MICKRYPGMVRSIHLVSQIGLFIYHLVHLGWRGQKNEGKEVDSWNNVKILSVMGSANSSQYLGLGGPGDGKSVSVSDIWILSVWNMNYLINWTFYLLSDLNYLLPYYTSKVTQPLLISINKYDI